MTIADGGRLQQQPRQHRNAADIVDCAHHSDQNSRRQDEPQRLMTEPPPSSRPKCRQR